MTNWIIKVVLILVILCNAEIKMDFGNKNLLWPKYFLFLNMMQPNFCLQIFAEMLQTRAKLCNEEESNLAKLDKNSF